ncbi:MAG: hypothetical protein IH586_22565 [Anaerolineaceae bacterium]|nr:hypothetical protein [Anaerolineaceae bacterium]
MITGLGATPIETALPARKSQVEPQYGAVAADIPVERPAMNTLRMSAPAEKQGAGEKNAPARTLQMGGPAATTADLDLPAFMRRRIRQISG